MIITIDQISRILNQNPPKPSSKEVHYAVLAPLVVREGRIHLLYELRSEELRRQPGDVSFPGGKVEKSETPEQCAVRETIEELGISEEDVKLIGELCSVNTYDGFSLSCFVAELKDRDFNNSINLVEVQRVFMVPLDYFFDNDPVKVSSWYEYRYKGFLIWGLTAKLTLKLIDIMLEFTPSPRDM